MRAMGLRAALIQVVVQGAIFCQRCPQTLVVVVWTCYQSMYDLGGLPGGGHHVWCDDSNGEKWRAWAHSFPYLFIVCDWLGSRTLYAAVGSHGMIFAARGSRRVSKLPGISLDCLSVISFAIRQNVWYVCAEPQNKPHTKYQYSAHHTLQMKEPMP